MANTNAQDLNDADSSLGDDDLDDLSSTVSINSSILAHRHENGRRYHAYKDGKYLGPNDVPEQDRLDLQHHLFTLTFDGKLHLYVFHQFHDVLFCFSAFKDHDSILSI